MIESHQTHPSFDEEKSKESPPVVRLTVLTAEEMADRVLDERSHPKERFQSPREGGVFELFWAEDLLDEHEQTSRYIVLTEDEHIVGIGKLRRSPRSETMYEPSVSVDPAYQSKGYGRRIQEKEFELAKEMGWKLQVFYTQQGQERLKKVSQELAKKYGVEVIDDSL